MSWSQFLELMIYLLYNMVRRNEAVHGIKVANKLALKQGDYSGLFC